MDAIHAEMDNQIAVGGFTIEEYAKKYGLPEQTAYSRLRKMIDLGKIEKLGKRLSANGRWLNAYDIVRK